MGWGDRKAAKKLQQERELWQQKHDFLLSATSTLQAVAGGADGANITRGLILSKDERALWTRDASLVEVKSIGGSWQGRSQGVSFHVAKGVNYRIGANRGHYVPNPAHESVIDGGHVVVTTRRVVFSGASQTREWLYTKMVGREITPSGAVMIQVSNRQKASGVFAGQFADAWIEIGAGVTRRGIEATRNELEQMLREHGAQQPTPIAADRSSAPLLPATPPPPAVAATPPPPAGWYSDPYRRKTYRYWDGERWTDYESDGAGT